VPSVQVSRHTVDVSLGEVNRRFPPKPERRRARRRLTPGLARLAFCARLCPARVLLVSCDVIPGLESGQDNALTCGKTDQGIVEVAGIEPASSGFSMGLLRAQPALDCRDRLRCRRQSHSVSD
jgi:hypothetical protein